MEQKPLSWKERKSQEAAICKAKLQRVFRLNPTLDRPGARVKTQDGARYEIQKNGSWKRIG
jgi:hypothetical protein